MAETISPVIYNLVIYLGNTAVESHQLKDLRCNCVSSLMNAMPTISGINPPQTAPVIASD